MATKILAQVIAERDNQVVTSITQLDMNIIATWHEATLEREGQVAELSAFIKDCQDGKRKVDEIVVTDDGYRFKPSSVKETSVIPTLKEKAKVG